MQSNQAEVPELSDKELALLGLVAEEPSHAYRLQAKVRERSMERWTLLSFSSVYRVLGGLQTKGLIETRQEHEGQGPTRKVYEIAPAGTLALQRAVLERLAVPNERPNPFQVALANMAFVAPGAAADALTLRLAAVEAARLLVGRHSSAMLGTVRQTDLTPGAAPAPAPALCTPRALNAVAVLLESVHCQLDAEERFVRRVQEALVALAAAEGGGEATPTAGDPALPSGSHGLPREGTPRPRAARGES